MLACAAHYDAQGFGMVWRILFCTSLLLSASALANSETEPRYIIDVLTIEPGDDALSSWGHTAVRVQDRQDGSDWIYDYGRFLISDDFLRSFITKGATYSTGRRTWKKALNRYAVDRHRQILAQRIELPREQAAALVSMLTRDIEPAHSDYLYDSLVNNCTTKVRDRLDEVTGGCLADFAKGRPTGETYRTVSNRHIRDRPLVWLLINTFYDPFGDTDLDAWALVFEPDGLLALLDDVRRGASTCGSALVVGPIVELAPSARTSALERRRHGIQQWAMWVTGLLLLTWICFVAPALWPHQPFLSGTASVGLWLWCGVAGLLGVAIVILLPHPTPSFGGGNLNLTAMHPGLLILPLLVRTRAQFRAVSAGIFAIPPLIGVAVSPWVQDAHPFVQIALIVHISLWIRIRRQSREVDNPTGHG